MNNFLHQVILFSSFLFYPCISFSMTPITEESVFKVLSSIVCHNQEGREGIAFNGERVSWRYHPGESVFTKVSYQYLAQMGFSACLDVRPIEQIILDHKNVSCKTKQKYNYPEKKCIQNVIESNVIIPLVEDNYMWNGPTDIDKIKSLKDICLAQIALQKFGSLKVRYYSKYNSDIVNAIQIIFTEIEEEIPLLFNNFLEYVLFSIDCSIKNQFLKQYMQDEALKRVPLENKLFFSMCLNDNSQQVSELLKEVKNTDVISNEKTIVILESLINNNADLSQIFEELILDDDRLFEIEDSIDKKYSILDQSEVCNYLFNDLNLLQYIPDFFVSYVQKNLKNINSYYHKDDFIKTYKRYFYLIKYFGFFDETIHKLEPYFLYISACQNIKSKENKYKASEDIYYNHYDGLAFLIANGMYNYELICKALTNVRTVDTAKLLIGAGADNFTEAFLAIFTNSNFKSEQFGINQNKKDLIYYFLSLQDIDNEIFLETTLLYDILLRLNLDDETCKYYLNQVEIPSVVSLFDNESLDEGQIELYEYAKKLYELAFFALKHQDLNELSSYIIEHKEKFYKGNIEVAKEKISNVMKTNKMNIKQKIKHIKTNHPMVLLALAVLIGPILGASLFLIIFNNYIKKIRIEVEGNAT